jgi:two-component system alkaline phosphatase synthesis response regulator PhoP
MEKLHVLLVDDDIDFMEAVKTTLKKHGIQVTTATDGKEGLHKAQTLDLDLVILDVMLPEKDGYFVCHELKENKRTEKIPVIMLTSLGKQDEGLSGAELLSKGHAADAYLEKPVEPETLVTTTMDLIDKSRTTPKKPTKVLLIDDDPDFIAAVKTTLESNGYSTVIAYTGEDGLLAVRKDNPDIILLDVMLPEKDGYAVCKELNEDEKTRSIPVIMLTSLGQKLTEPDYAKAIAVTHKADDYIEKPVEEKELLKRIRQLIGPMRRLV